MSSSEELPLKIGHITYKIGDLVQYNSKEYRYLGLSSNNSVVLGEVFHRTGDEAMLVNIDSLDPNNFRKVTRRVRRKSAPSNLGSKKEKRSKRKKSKRKKYKRKGKSKRKGKR